MSKFDPRFWELPVDPQVQEILDASERKAFAQSSDLAFGRAWYWVKRD